jgi:hypothetical protein
MGRGKAPKIVEEARAAGAKTKDEINEFIRQKRLTQGLNKGKGQSGTMLEQYAAEQGRTVSPYLGDNTGPSPLLVQPTEKPIGAPLTPSSAQATAAFTSATREQTDALLETLRKQEGNSAQMLAELKRGPGRPGSPLIGSY